MLRRLLPRRADETSKADYGRLLVIAGNRGMGGAGLLAAEAGLRAGAGLVKLVTHPDHVSAALARRPEIMVHGADSLQDLQKHLPWPQVLVIGPGLGQDYWGEQMLYQACAHAVKNSGCKLIMDADALNLIAQKPHWLQGLKTPLIITPHPGEAARLLASDTKSVQQNRPAAATNLAQKYQCCAVLKGHHSLVANEQDLWVCKAGNPGLASAGTGDVLAGLIGGLWAQGAPHPAVASLGVWLHASAGDLAAKQHGQAGMLASDLFPQIETLLQRLE